MFAPLPTPIYPRTSAFGKGFEDSLAGEVLATLGIHTSCNHRGGDGFIEQGCCVKFGQRAIFSFFLGVLETNPHPVLVVLYGQFGRVIGGSPNHPQTTWVWTRYCPMPIM